MAFDGELLGYGLPIGSRCNAHLRPFLITYHRLLLSSEVLSRASCYVSMHEKYYDLQGVPVL